MTENPYRGIGGMKFTAILCFMVFGTVALMQQGDLLNPINIGFGILSGLVFALLSAILFRLSAGLFNRDTKKKYGPMFVTWVVWRGMLFLVPFAVMAALAALLLHWESAGLFISAGIMSAATAVIMEISRYHEKPKLKNSIVLPMTASILSMAWLFSVGWLKMAAGMLGALAGFLLNR